MSQPPVLPDGFAVGHWTDEAARTGCTVILAADGAVGGVDVRGAAPSTFCTDTLRPGNLIEHVHAVLLTGGSAFGLEAAAGVMRHLERSGIGFELATVRVPIVVGAVIFDLGVGDPRTRPGLEAGAAACAAAGQHPGVGAIGAGTGATVAKGGVPSEVRPGGLGVATAVAAGATVCAVMVVNSVGGIWDDERHEWVVPLSAWAHATALTAGTNTTIGAVLTDARLTREQANRLATVAHDGIARAIRPSRTMYDGDTIFCLATGTRAADYQVVQAAATVLVARAIASGVRAALDT